MRSLCSRILEVCKLARIVKYTAQTSRGSVPHDGERQAMNGECFFFCFVQKKHNAAAT